MDADVIVAVEMSTQPFKSFSFDGIFGMGLGALALGAKSFVFQQFLHGGKATAPRFGVFLTEGEDGETSEIATGDSVCDGGVITRVPMVCWREEERRG